MIVPAVCYKVAISTRIWHNPAIMIVPAVAIIMAETRSALVSRVMISFCVIVVAVVSTLAVICVPSIIICSPKVIADQHQHRKGSRGLHARNSRSKHQHRGGRRGLQALLMALS
jgi:hypothetical protein